MEKPVWERESFFKVMIGDFQTRLKIPPCFHKQLRDMNVAEWVLRSRGGRRWVVKLRREGSNLYFGEGWECFVSDLTVQLGEFLIFVYDGSLGFDVKIYGITGCEKEDHTLAVKMEETQEDSEEESEMSGKVEANNSGRLVRGRKSTALNRHVVLGGLKPRNKNGRALKSALSFKSNRPFFTATFRAYRQEYMTIPISFMRECDLFKTENITLKLPKGRRWTVRIAHWTGRSAMAKGWCEFTKVNHLTEGDVCVFEYFKRDNALYCHIFRAKESSSAVLEKTGRCKILEAVLKTQKSFKTDARFASIMLKSTLYNLNVPAHILKGWGATNVTKTTLCDPSGRLWAVDLRRRCDGRMTMSKGMSSFCEANHIQVGDACIFELTDGLKAMDVQIRRQELQLITVD